MTKKIREDMMDSVAVGVGAGGLVKNRKQTEKAARDAKAKKLRDQNAKIDKPAKPVSAFSEEETPKYDNYMDKRRRMEKASGKMGSNRKKK